MVGIDGQQLRGYYYGRTLNLDKVEDLNDDGKAMISITTIELACRGVSLYVDTDAENERYGDGYKARLEAVEAKRQAALATGVGPEATDPCALWTAPIAELQPSP